MAASPASAAAAAAGPATVPQQPAQPPMQVPPPVLARATSVEEQMSLSELLQRTAEAVHMARTSHTPATSALLRAAAEETEEQKQQGQGRGEGQDAGEAKAGPEGEGVQAVVVDALHALRVCRQRLHAATVAGEESLKQQLGIDELWPTGGAGATSFLGATPPRMRGAGAVSIASSSGSVSVSTTASAVHRLELLLTELLTAVSQIDKREEVPPPDWHYDFHFEILSLLLVLVSSQLYTPPLSSAQESGASYSSQNPILFRMFSEAAAKVERQHQISYEQQHPESSPQARQHHSQSQVVTANWEPHLVIEGLMHMIVHTAKPPPGSDCERLLHAMSMLDPAWAKKIGDARKTSGSAAPAKNAPALTEAGEQTPQQRPQEQQHQERDSGAPGEHKLQQQPSLAESARSLGMDKLCLTSTFLEPPYTLRDVGRSVLGEVGSAAVALVKLPFVGLYYFFGHTLNPNNNDGAAAAVANLTDMTKTTLTTEVRLPNLSEHLLAQRALTFLLLLIHNYRTSRSHNAFREAFCSMVDTQLSEYNAPMTSAASPAGTAAAAAAVAPPASPDRASRGGESDGSGGGDAGSATMMPTTPTGASTMRAGSSVATPTTPGELKKLSAHVSFDKIVSLLCTPGCMSLPMESSSLFLYSLMQDNCMFFDAMLSRSDFDAVLRPILSTLYCGGATRTPAQLYVLVIIIVQFTQDVSFNKTVFKRIHLASVPFYHDRILRDITLGSTIVLCLLRTLVHAFTRLHDSYLIQNCLAVLMNLAPHMEDLHPYACLRIVAVTMQLCRRICDLFDRCDMEGQHSTLVMFANSGGHADVDAVVAELEAQTAQRKLLKAEKLRRAANGGGDDEVREDGERGDDEEDGGDASGSSLDVDALGVDGNSNGSAPTPEEAESAARASQELYGLLETHAETLRILLKVIRFALRPTHRIRNIQLLYAVLHQFDEMRKYLEHPLLQASGWQMPLLPWLVELFEELQHSQRAAPNMSADRTLSTLQKLVMQSTGSDGSGVAVGWNPESMVTFSYEEGSDPEAFFVPYCWEIVCNSSFDMHWKADRIHAFQPPATPDANTGTGGAADADADAGSDAVTGASTGAPSAAAAFRDTEG